MMEATKNIALGFVYGLWDSVSGMTLVFYIDKQGNIEQQQHHHEEEEEEQHRSNMYNASTTISSSASDLLRRRICSKNSDERNLNEILINNMCSGSNLPRREKRIAKKTCKCCILNGGFTWLSTFIFEKILLPSLKYLFITCYGDQTEKSHIMWDWVQTILYTIFDTMWILPMFLVSKIVNSLWFADIANEAYLIRKGKPRLMSSISKLIADFLFSIIVQLLFLMQSLLVSLIPILHIGDALYFIHLCLLYSLYAFEYKWFNMGWELHKRLNYIEINWPYFLGFGLPLTILTKMSNSVIISSCIFSIFFPLFILSGNEAKPLVGTTTIPLRLFSPVIFVSNLMFRDNRTKLRHNNNRIIVGKTATVVSPNAIIATSRARERLGF